MDRRFAKGNRVAYAQWEDAGPFRTATTGNTFLVTNGQNLILTKALASMSHPQSAIISDYNQQM